ncbi:MAG: cupin domain-containing protein [Chloroflexi bacterium AL-W]|nr:cupin domain-containing protein [Chloroflexi bacterium AL-N1]NOK70102.1 cupin domain-containing protein [Chloroflexi bacterium AL-N10]NOK77886.1 cupin domain-containing protein [Chloroflexi bacterium AL-N5]NOK84895.1 cupin domain-containing protein [Chloroflexi bacterium AL-W]NOK91874.1 cupin domain-containing protein [Chloroflexi bacterium AL-N15]
MHIIDFATAPGAVIEQFASVGATSVHLGSGAGESHVYMVRFVPDGQIGEHPTGFGQLFLVIDGSGWVSGADGQRRMVSVG